MAPVWRKRFVAPEIACHRQRRPALAATDWTAWRDWTVWCCLDRLASEELPRFDRNIAALAGPTTRADTPMGRKAGGSAACFSLSYRRPSGSYR